MEHEGESPMTEWKLVPIEMTREMFNVRAGHSRKSWWNAVLAAAPEPPYDAMTKREACLLAAAEKMAKQLERAKDVFFGFSTTPIAEWQTKNVLQAFFRTEEVSVRMALDAFEAFKKEK
jgi:hypothetical protein